MPSTPEQPRSESRTGTAASTPYRSKGVPAGLSLAQVVDAAVEHIEAHGYETLTMRKLATALRVTPMTIYRHVADKRALLSLVGDRYFDELRPPAVEADWRVYLRDWFDALHELMLRRPVLAHVMAEQPLDGPVAWRAAEQVIGVLVGHGFRPSEAGELFTALLSYAIGFALVRRGRSANGTEGAVEVPPDRPAADFPHLAEAMGAYGRWLSTRSFVHGVQVFVEAWEGERDRRPATGGSG